MKKHKNLPMMIKYIGKLANFKIKDVRNFLDTILQSERRNRKELEKTWKDIKKSYKNYDFLVDSYIDDFSDIKRTSEIAYQCITTMLTGIFEDTLKRLLFFSNREDICRRCVTKMYFDDLVKEIKRPPFLVDIKNIRFENQEMRFYPTAVKIRDMNNCFKHNNGKANDRYNEKYGIEINERIPYEEEDWNDIITKFEEYIESIVRKAKNAVSEK